MLPAYVVTALYAGLATWSVLRLPAFHPVQLWAVPWALVSFLYSLRLLPFQAVEPQTAALIVAAGAAFCSCALVGERVQGSRPSRLLRREPVERVAVAAKLAFLITAVLLGAYLGQVASSFGLHDAILATTDVRNAIGEGSFPVTIKYVYPAIAATVLAAIAAGATQQRRLRLYWAGATLAGIGSLYFSSGRSVIVLVAFAALVAYAMRSRLRLGPGTLFAGVYCVVGLVLAVHVTFAELQGRPTVDSAVSNVPSPLRNTKAEVLVLPYAYATAPIAALDDRVGAAEVVGGANGCATLRNVCSGLHRAGLGEEGRPPILGFTAEPLDWNTYTALDLPLSDGGILLAVPILALTGLGAGFAWGLAIRRSTAGILVYAMVAGATVYSVVQYSFLASHLVAASLIGIGLLWAAGAERVAVLLARARAAVESVPAAVWVVLMFGVGAALRLAVSLAYQPATATYEDTGEYVRLAQDDLLAGVAHPGGYPAFLRLLQLVSGRLEFTIAVQHLLGLGAGLLLYTGVRRLGAPVWAGMVAAAGLILSLDLVALEHTILTEAVFTFLLSVVVYGAIRALDEPVKLWRELRSRDAWLLLASGSLAYAALVRPVALVLIPGLAAWVFLVMRGGRRQRLRWVTAASLPAVATVLLYAALHDSETGQFGLSQSGGRILYGKVAPFADCERFDPPPGTAELCETIPPDGRPGPIAYYGDPSLPAVRRFGPPPGGDAELGEFARAAILADPLGYARAVGVSTLQYVAPGIEDPGLAPTFEALDLDHVGPNAASIEARLETYYDDVAIERAGTVETLTEVQQVLRLHPILILAAVIIAAAGLRAANARERAGIAALLGVGLLLLVGSSFALPYDPRYTVPVGGVLLGAGALGGAAILRSRSARRQPSPSEKARYNVQAP